MTRGYDQHFLVRLERLGREHVELALGLYYDRRLVEHVLGVAGLPDDAERVALCLGEADVGPHVIVARDGHFDTCLAEGSQLTREEFDDVARWLPLLETDFLLLHMESVAKCHELVDQLARVKHWNQRNDSLLHMYWRLNWAIAHLTMLLASDDERLRNLADRLESMMPGASMQFAWSLLRLGVMQFAVRGVWAASKIPAFIVPSAKRRYLDPDATFLSTMSDGLSLSAAALRHRRYQGEVRKTLERGRPNPDEDDFTIPEVRVRGYCSVFFEQLVHEPQTCLDYIVQVSRHLVENGLIGPPENRRAIAQLPDHATIGSALLRDRDRSPCRRRSVATRRAHAEAAASTSAAVAHQASRRPPRSRSGRALANGSRETAKASRRAAEPPARRSRPGSPRPRG